MKQIRHILTVLLMFSAVLSVSAKEVFYNVLDFGAKGDGKTNCTKAINAAIEAASKNGGGTVFFPAGNFLSYTIRLKSKITLHLDQGAVLIGDKEKNGVGYDLPEEDAVEADRPGRPRIPEGGRLSSLSSRSTLAFRPEGWGDGRLGGSTRPRNQRRLSTKEVP